MKLNSDGVTISILILITMILICHTMNYLYPKNKFANIPQTTNYNEIYYSNQNSKLCSNINTGGDFSSNMLSQAEIPCDVISSCSSNGGCSCCSGCVGCSGCSGCSGGGGCSGCSGCGGTNKYLETLSDSELAVLYKVAYENAQREIVMRTLSDISTKI